MTTSHRIKNLSIKLLQHPSKRHVSQDAGFSLLEMIVVMAIIGILSAITAPSWLGFVNRQRLNKANDAVLSVIRQTQIEAKNKKRNYSVSFRVNSTTNIPEYIIYQGTPPTTITTTTTPSSNTSSSSGWKTLGETLSLKSRQVFLYTNLTSLTAHNTTTTGQAVVTSTTGTGTITFDYFGALANKDNNNTVADSLIKVVVAMPQPSGNAADSLKRCVIIQGLIAGMRTEKDTYCQ